MRLPLILAQEPVAVQPGVRMPVEAAGAAFQGLAVAGRQVQQLGEHVSERFAAAEAQRRRLDDTIQRGEVLAQLGETVTTDMQALKGQGLSPEEYEIAGVDLVEQRIKAAQATIRDPEGQRRFQVEAARFGATARSAVRKTAYEGTLARMGLEAVGSMTRLANEAVWGVTPAAQAAAYAELTALPEAMARTGVWSADEAKAQKATALAQVERGVIDRDARNPALIGDVLNLLGRGAYTALPASVQSDILDELLRKGNAARVDADRQRKEEQEETERGLVVRLRDAATPAALAAVEDEVRGLLAPARRGLTSEKGEHLFTLIDAKRNPPEKDNDAVVRPLQQRVMGLHTTEREADAIAVRVDAALVAKDITPTTHRIWMNELQSKKDRLKAAPLDKFLVEEHKDVEASINRVIRTRGPMATDFDAQTEAVRDEALMEHNRLSKANGGAEASREWWDRRRPYYVARQITVATGYILGVQSGLPRAYQPVGLNLQNPVASKAAIEQARLKAQQLSPTDPARVDVGRKLMELRRLFDEVERLQATGLPTPGGAKPTPSAGGAATPTRVEGRPR